MGFLLSIHLCHVLDEVDDLVGITPLIQGEKRDYKAKNQPFCYCFLSVVIIPQTARTFKKNILRTHSIKPFYHI